MLSPLGGAALRFLRGQHAPQIEQAGNIRQDETHPDTRSECLFFNFFYFFFTSSFSSNTFFSLMMSQDTKKRKFGDVLRTAFFFVEKQINPEALLSHLADIVEG